MLAFRLACLGVALRVGGVEVVGSSTSVANSRLASVVYGLAFHWPQFKVAIWLMKAVIH